MANRERGEASLTVGTKVYTLRPTLGAYCELEDRIDADHQTILEQANAGSARMMRAVLWSWLQAKHAAEFDTFESVSDLVDRVGLAEVQAQLSTLERVNGSPEAREGNGRRTRRRNRSTGGSSTLPPDDQG